MDIKIEGDFSTEAALEWKVKLNELCKNSEALTIDLRNTTSADIVGVNALATSFKLSKDNAHQLDLVVKQDSEIYKMLHLTKFLEVIPNKIV